MKAIIIEDEKLILDDLKDIISETSEEIEVVKTFKNGLDPIMYLQDNDIDIMFVDINIPLLDGMSLAKTINKFKQKPYIVFITAHKEYAAQAFEIEVFDYVLKPYTKERIQNIVKKIIEIGKNKSVNTDMKNESHKNSLSNMQNKITIKDKNSMVVIDSDDIFYLEAKEKFTYIKTDKENYEIHYAISDIQQQLPENKFFRCHRSYVVNLDKIVSIESNGISSYKVKLSGEEEEIPVGRRKIKELKLLLNIV